MKKQNRFLLYLLVFLAAFTFVACDDDEGESGGNTVDPEPLDPENGYGLDLDSDLSQVPLHLLFNNKGDEPPSVDLTRKFPPIGNQGNSNSCVAWAMAYNIKSYLDGLDKGLALTELSIPENQFSPLDLYLATPERDCNVGTDPVFAAEVLQLRGVARLSTAPYDESCEGGPEQSWTNDASSNKIQSFRQIGYDFTLFKNLLAQEKPIFIGARMAPEWSNFPNAPFDGRMDTFSPPQPGQPHSGHAMLLAGYDDSLNSFLVINSWGTSWGENGYGWMDYQVAEQSIMYGLIFQNEGTFGSLGSGTPDSDGDDQVDDDNIVSGEVDLLAWDLQDWRNSDDPTGRTRNFLYNVFNMGDQTIPASADWSVVYAYYNAYDANDFGLIMLDYYTDDYPVGDTNNGPIPEEDYGEFDYTSEIGFNWWNNVDIPGGSSISAVNSGNDDGFESDYEIPEDVNGSYYLVLIADPLDEVDEFNEENNYYYFSNPDGSPLEVVNGVISVDFTGERTTNSRVTSFVPSPTNRKPTQKTLNPNPNVNRGESINAYHPEEITAFLKMKQENGELKRMINKGLKSGSLKSKKRAFGKK